MKSFFRQRKTNKKATISLIIFSVIVGFYSINLLLVIAGITVLYIALKQRPMAIFSNWLSKALGAVFIYTLLIAAVCSVGSLFNKDFALSLAPIINLAILALSFAFYHQFSPKEKLPESPKTSWSVELPSIIITLVALAVLILPPFFRYGPEGGILAQMNANVDDSVHLAMINDRIHFNQDFYLDNSPEVVRAEDKISYPATWHSANAVLIKAMAPHVTTGFQTLVVYVLSKLFWVAVLIYFLARLTIQRFSHVDPKTPAFYFGCGLLLMFSYIAALSQSLFGFYNFIPQLISLLIISSLVFASSIPKRDTLLVGAFAVVGGGMAWFLLLPVMTIALLLVLAFSFTKNHVRQSIATISQSLRTYPFMYLVLVVAMLQQIYIATLSSESISFIQNIILAGEVARYSMAFFITLIIGSLAYFFLFERKKDTNTSASLWTASVMILFAGTILAICLIKTGEPQYYYFKVVSAIVVMFIPLCIAGFMKLFQLLSTKIEGSIQWPAIIITLSLIAISLFPTFSATGNILSFMKGERPATIASNTSVLSNLQPQSSYDAQVGYKIYYNHRSFPQSFINTMLVKSNQPDNPCFREPLGKLISDNSALAIALTAAKTCGDHPISVVVPASELAIIQDIFTQNQLPSTVTVLSE